MGELIKIINKVGDLNVEINEPTHIGGQRNIHVQNSNFRFSVPEGDFLKIAVSIKKGISVIKHNKEIE